MPEQFELDLIIETPEEELQRLAKKYKEIFGPNPLNRGFDKATISNALANPEKERARLYETDKEDDQKELRSTNRR